MWHVVSEILRWFFCILQVYFCILAVLPPKKQAFCFCSQFSSAVCTEWEEPLWLSSLLVWCSVSHWQIVSGWCLEETQPPVSFLWHVSVRNMLVEGREKGTDNINMSNLKLQHPCYASSRMLLNNDSLCQWCEVAKFQTGLKIKFSCVVNCLERALFLDGKAHSYVRDGFD